MLWWRLRQLRSDSSAKQLLAIKALGRSRHARANPSAITGYFLPFLDSQIAEMRQAAADALQGLGWKPSTPDERAALAIACGDYETAVQQGAAGLSRLKEALNQNSLRTPAIRALGKTGDPTVVLPLIQELERRGDRNEIRQQRLKGEVVEALVSIGQAALPLLVEQLASDTCLLREAAEEVILRVGDSSLSSLIVGKVSPQSRNYEQQESLARLIGQLHIHDQSAIRCLKLLAKYDAGLAEVEVRRAATDALAAVDETLDSLIELLGDDEMGILAQQHLEDAADNLNEERRGELVRKVVAWMERQGSRQRHQCAIILFKKLRHPAAVPALIRELGHEGTRSYAISALGAIGDKRALEPLISLIADNPDLVGDKVDRSRWHSAAARALKSFVDSDAVDLLGEALQKACKADVKKAYARYASVRESAMWLETTYRSVVRGHLDKMVNDLVDLLALTRDLRAIPHILSALRVQSECLDGPWQVDGAIRSLIDNRAAEIQGKHLDALLSVFRDVYLAPGVRSSDSQYVFSTVQEELNRREAAQQAKG